MAFDVSPRSGVRGQVNITPLIDVVLVLLIIFMVMMPTTMKHMKPALAQDSAAAAPTTAPLLVEMNEAGVSVAGQLTPWGQLHQAVREGLGRGRQTTVLLKISDDVAYGEAVRVMDLCRGAGAQTLALPPRG
jgi:biopolymer transport protein ExbD